MTWEDMIRRVAGQVRDALAWPDGSGDLQRKLDLLYVAALSVTAELPLAHLTTTSATLTGENAQGTMKRYPMPDKVNDVRADLGISHVSLDGQDYYPGQSVPYAAVAAAGGNAMQAGNPLFAIDLDARAVYANAATSVRLSYAPRPVKATTGNYDSTDYPFEGIRAERCAQIVAAHSTGVQARDSAAAQFHGLLEQGYQTADGRRQTAGAR